ncbi:MAG: hypothetical protein KGL39_58135 [Patescibacteria group bacterium]|nr:hypothetical protein [Patescibacteria group bacterium]
MGWARIDDAMDEHPKIASTGALGLALHIAAICYSSRRLTDGIIPAAAIGKLISLEDFTHGKKPSTTPVTHQMIADRLVASNAWHRGTQIAACAKCAERMTGRDLSGSFVLHDYLDYNPSRSQVVSKRARDSQRKGDGIHTESTRNPHGIHTESNEEAERIPHARDHARGGDPVPRTPVSGKDGGERENGDRALSPHGKSWFDDFMAAYPAKRDGMRWNRSAAGAAFRHYVADSDQALVVRAAENYAKCRDVVEDGVIYAPDNWLSGNWRVWLVPEEPKPRKMHPFGPEYDENGRATRVVI